MYGFQFKRFQSYSKVIKNRIEIPCNLNWVSEHDHLQMLIRVLIFGGLGYEINFRSCTNHCGEKHAWTTVQEKCSTNRSRSSQGPQPTVCIQKCWSQSWRVGHFRRIPNYSLYERIPNTCSANLVEIFYGCACSLTPLIT